MLSKKNLNRIWQIYAVGIVAYAILGSLALYFMNHSTFAVSTNYLTNNDLASQTNTVFASGSNVFWNIEYRYAIIALLAVCLIVPGIYVNQILSGKKKINLLKLRWLDWTITSSIMLSLIAILSSLQDLMTILLVVGLNVVGYLLAWFAIHERNISKDNAKKLFKLEIAALILPWILILFYALGTWIYGGVRSPWYVYTLYAVGIISTIKLIYGFFWHQKIVGKEKQLSVEAYPIVLNQIIKVAFSLILIIGLWN